MEPRLYLQLWFLG